MAGLRAGDWARYWRVDGLPVEAMHAHFTAHVYHRHSHESYSFGVTETGAQAFTCRHGRHVSGAGMVMTFNPDDPHDGHAAGEAGFTYRMVHIWPEFFAALIGDAPLPLFGSPVIDDPVVARSLRRLHDALTTPAGELERYERLSGTARLLLRHASGRGRLPGGAEGAEGLRGPGDRAAARVRDLIHDRYATADLTADDLGAAAGCSRYAAYRAFTKAYGMAPSDYQRQLRVRAARRLLVQGVTPALAAAETGFADQAHLTRWFHRYYGITPGAYQAAGNVQVRR
jgi:AraC-like DNA-binding protein